MTIDHPTTPTTPAEWAAYLERRFADAEPGRAASYAAAYLATAIRDGFTDAPDVAALAALVLELELEAHR